MVLVYYDDILHDLALAPHYISTLNDISIRDYKKDYFRCIINCLDLDAYEQDQSGQNDCTIDGAIGIATYENNMSKDPRLLLVELRFGYDSTRHFDKDNMLRKVLHSKQILIPKIVDNQVIFLYTEYVSPKAQSYFNRLKTQYSEIRTWKAMSNKDFITYIDFIQNQPYTPITNIKQLKHQLETACDFNDFVNKSDYWKNQADIYRTKYNLQEAKIIYELLLSSWENYQKCLQDDDTKEYQKIETLKLKNILESI